MSGQPVSSRLPSTRFSSSRWATRLFDLFEDGVMLILTIVIVLLAALSLWRLVASLVVMLAEHGLNPSDPQVLQRIFGMIFTVLIALEFKHSLLRIGDGRDRPAIRIRSVILIGMLTTVRKFIIMDIKDTGMVEMLSLSAAILCLGIVYWLVRDPTPRLPGEPS
ncbi:phosphate-starvation-inducible PsiE family protein [Granulibacter bethesdensis]|uniref:phosphate-starvation-inducible PsiE family protein n=1 Tax=Granulibacter bethesdensis TaxID=364410 RepID=UPI000932BCA6|nr:phosphate-starvation-inducible PsiE family protein [Granulibacter bethesdensis]